MNVDFSCDLITSRQFEHFFLFAEKNDRGREREDSDVCVTNKLESLSLLCISQID